MPVRFANLSVKNGFVYGLVLFFSLSCLAADGKADKDKKPGDWDEDAQGNSTVLKREKWFLQGRTMPGQSAAALRLRAFQQKQEMIKRLQQQDASDALQGIEPSFGSGPTWQPLGPMPLISDPTGQQSYGNVAGRVTAIAVDQSDASGNTVYVGGAYGGVWKSTNAATANPASVVWTPVTDDQATLAVGAIAVSPNGQTVLVGTGEGNLSDSYYGLGILISTQAGAPGTFRLITTADGGAHSFAGLGVAKIAFNTNNPSSVVATFVGVRFGTITGLDNGIAKRGIYYSTDGGASWHLATLRDGSTVLTAASASEVVFDPNHSTFYAASRFHGIYQSTDGGANWTRLANQPDPADVTTTHCPTSQPQPMTSCAMYRGQLAFNPNTNELFAWFVDFNNTDKGIWKTTNGGASGWTQVSDTTITSCGDSNGCGTQQGFYDLYLSAVPHSGGGTDLYAGAVNLFKSINGSAFLNLTHVYGCNPGPLATTAHMHPDYHAQDFLRSNPNVIYFGNDGGIYRTLSGPSVTIGSCGGGMNPIDNLNSNIGSLTQFYSFSQHPTDPTILIGGTQDNGSPGITTAGNSMTWTEVNSGDGGFNEIDPNNPFNVFTSNTDVSISYCTANANDPTCILLFYNPVVSVTSFGPMFPANFPDHGDFITPFILDPADPSKVIIGTCRVWRGSATLSTNWSNASFSNALSNKFTDGTATACTDTESAYVHALAAGGPNSGFGSSVIYAGTTDGKIFVSTNAASGVTFFNDVTGNTNPGHFVVSDVAVDRTVASGQTAYMTIMGFTGSFGHVFKTTNAGGFWTDISNGLPDAPADSVVVDPINPSILYVGTDVGIFRSSDGGASWAPYGTFFPNVVVNKLRIFNSGGTELLRASTHGRGVWQINARIADYSLSVSNPLVTVFPNQTGTFNGSAAFLGGYSNSVALTFQGNVPPTRSIAPSSVTPAQPSFTVTASATMPQDYNFSIQGVGGDPQTLTHQTPVTLRVIDFALSAPAPGSASIYPNTSGNASFTVSPLGQFSDPVLLTCGGLPAGVSCNFAPAIATPTPGVPVNVTLTLSATNAALGGTYAITIIGTDSVFGVAHSSNLTLNVIDYAFTGVASQQSIYPGQSTTFNGTLSAINGYSFSVALACAAGQTVPPSPCGVVPASVTPSTPGTFTLTAGDNPPHVPQDYLFNIQATGGDPGATLRLQAIRLRVVDFTLGGLTPNVSVAQSSISQPILLQIIPQGTFGFPVTLSCNGLPAGATCFFNGAAEPVTVAPPPNSNPLNVQFVIETSAAAVSGSGITVTGTTNPPPPAGPRATPVPLTLTVTASAGSTDMAVSDAAPEATPAAHSVGAPLTFSLNVSNNGIAINNAALFASFAEPQFVVSAGVQGGSACTGVPGFVTSLTCPIGAMSVNDSRTVTITLQPGLARSLTLQAVVNDSVVGDSNLANNTANITRQVRLRPFVIKNFPPRLP